jgi:hypothetical protein
MNIVNGETIASFEKSAKKEVRVSIDLFGGKPYINLREFYLDADEWKPGKGITIPTECYRELAEMLVVVGDRLRGDGLIP